VGHRGGRPHDARPRATACAPGGVTAADVREVWFLAGVQRRRGRTARRIPPQLRGRPRTHRAWLGRRATNLLPTATTTPTQDGPSAPCGAHATTGTWPGAVAAAHRSTLRSAGRTAGSGTLAQSRCMTTSNAKHQTTGEAACRLERFERAARPTLVWMTTNAKPCGPKDSTDDPAVIAAIDLVRWELSLGT
jgi:hypothetical protein